MILSNLVVASEYSEQLIDAELARARQDPDNSTTLNVFQPIELVFDALLARLAEYSEDIESIEFDNNGSDGALTLGVGSERITTMEDGKRLIQRIVVFDPPNTFAYFTDMAKSTVSAPIDYSIGYYSFSEQQDGSVEARVSMTYKPSSRLTSFLVRLGFSRALSSDFRKAEAYLNSLTAEDERSTP
ncbi:MAG: hypothetical protein DHS20C12_00780 [Pseudohongiella sp.]|nr:MAG: hypothetical protein DHS20C12_00780 [Pseudohongiella sp.]